ERALSTDLNSLVGDFPNHSEDQRRSIAWIKALSAELHEVYGDTARVLSKYDNANRNDLGLNELLYDINVVETRTVRSASGRHELHFVNNALWEIESEFQENDSKS